MAPSGEQLEIGYEDQVAVLVEVGGGLRGYSVGGRDVLDGYAVDDMCTGGRGQLLVPWPGRIEDGRYRVGDEDLQLDLSEPAAHNAIHGLARFANWTIAERAADRVALEYLLHSHPGYPFVLSLRAEYALSARGLTVRTSVRNLGARAAPFGMGAHPYLSAGPTTLDAEVLELPAESYLSTDARGLPISTLPVEKTPYDFRRPRPIGATHIDHSFTGLSRDRDGCARVVMRAPDGTDAVTLWADRSFPFIQVYTGDTLPDASRRRRGLAVEPMTCAPNAFRTGNGLRMLEPDETWTGTFGIEPVFAKAA